MIQVITTTAESVNSLLKAIEIYTDMGKFTMAAKHHQTIADTFETEVVNTPYTGGQGVGVGVRLEVRVQGQYDLQWCHSQSRYCIASICFRHSSKQPPALLPDTVWDFVMVA